LLEKSEAAPLGQKRHIVVEFFGVLMDALLLFKDEFWLVF
jgi:hypothetical protein